MFETLARLNPFGRKSAQPLTMQELERVLRIGPSAKSGVHVNWQTALEVSAVFSCLRVVSEGVAQVPFKLMRQRGREILPATDHPLYDVLHRCPNDWMSSFELREAMVIHAMLTGNAYCFVNRVNGKVVELLPLLPADCTPKMADDWTITYTVRARDGSTKDFPASSIWHLRGPSWNGWKGMPAVNLAREAIGLAIATENHHARMHANGVLPSGLLSVNDKLNETQEKQLRSWFEQTYMGDANRWKAMILDRDAKWTPMAFTGVDAQHLETRRHQIEEICRFFRVMPIMVGLSDKAATYASSEQMFLAHVVHTLSPWYERIEQSVDVQLLGREERAAGFYCKFNTRGLLRGALKDTADYLYKLVSVGVMTRNEARENLDLNPKDGLDEPLTPANTMPAGKADAETNDA